jgi:hypothetical protein
MKTATFLLLAALGAAATPARAAITTASGYAARFIPTPGTVQGGVARVGEAILVGQGPGFTAGAQSIVRLTEGGGATTIATGFNSLGGIDLAPDGTLWLVDNCLAANGDACGATATGDTLFAIPEALTRATSLPAVGQEVLPAGTIPSAMDVLVLGRAVLVSDAAGDEIGRVVRVKGSGATDLVTGLDFAGGLGRTCDGTLLVGDVDADTFAGSVFTYSPGGRLLDTLSSTLSGALAHVVDADGQVLVSGGFTGDFSSSTVVAIAPGGAVTERARGFGFSSEMAFDARRDETLVLDFGVSRIEAICRDRDGDGVCDADDNCPAAANAGQADADADGLGDVCECAAPVALAAAVKIGKLAGPPGDETIGVKGEMTVPFPFVPSLDPVANGVRIRVEDAAGAAVVDASLPGGPFDPLTGSGWKANGAGTAWSYRSCAGRFGVDQVSIRQVTRSPGRLKLALKGKRGGYAPGVLPLRVTVVVDAAGQCGTAAFAAAECAVSSSGNTLRCS